MPEKNRCVCDAYSYERFGKVCLQPTWMKLIVSIVSQHRNAASDSVRNDEDPSQGVVDGGSPRECQYTARLSADVNCSVEMEWMSNKRPGERTRSKVSSPQLKVAAWDGVGFPC